MYSTLCSTVKNTVHVQYEITNIVLYIRVCMRMHIHKAIFMHEYEMTAFDDILSSITTNF